MRKAIVMALVLSIGSTAALAETITLQAVIDRLLEATTRGRIIGGQHQVSKDKFDAEKIGYYIPEISFNTTLPSYRQRENYDTYAGYANPILFKQTNISSTGNIRMRQKVITGGDLTLQTGFDIRNEEFPVGTRVGMSDLFEYRRGLTKWRLGDLLLQFNQPLFQTSTTRSSYFQARDNMDKAEIEWRINRANLKKEGITAYFDLLTADLDKQIADDQRQAAGYKAQWDSVKYERGVITEEAWIESKSGRLEKHLALYDAEATLEEKANTFTHLLDLPSDPRPTLEIPVVPSKPDETRARALMANVERSAETELARINMAIAERDLQKTRGALGINGTLSAAFSIGRGNVEQNRPDTSFDDDVNTKDWRVSLEFSYPIWDGGASQANLHSQELAYESSRLEYLAAQRSGKNNMEILLRRTEINNSKLDLLEQEVGLAEKKLREAEGRFAEGMISDATLLENRIFYLEARKSYLTTLKSYYLDSAELEKIDLP